MKEENLEKNNKFHIYFFMDSVKLHCNNIYLNSTEGFSISILFFRPIILSSEEKLF